MKPSEKLEILQRLINVGLVSGRDVFDILKLSDVEFEKMVDELLKK